MPSFVRLFFFFSSFSFCPFSTKGVSFFYPFIIHPVSPSTGYILYIFILTIFNNSYILYIYIFCRFSRVFFALFVLSAFPDYILIVFYVFCRLFCLSDIIIFLSDICPTLSFSVFLHPVNLFEFNRDCLSTCFL